MEAARHQMALDKPSFVELSRRKMASPVVMRARRNPVMTRMKAHQIPKSQRESGGAVEKVSRRDSNAALRAVGRATQEQSICKLTLLCHSVALLFASSVVVDILLPRTSTYMRPLPGAGYSQVATSSISDRRD